MTEEGIDAMLAAGATAEVIAALWKAEISAREKAVAERRSKDRDRQRCHRASRDVTVTERESQPVQRVFPKENKSNPIQETQSPIGDSPSPRKSKRSADFEVPDWVPAEPWAAFAEMRRRKKKPLDDFTAKQLFGRLRSIKDAGWNLDDVITKAAIGNHDGFWMPDGRDSNIRRTAGSNGSTHRPMTIEELKRGIARAEDYGDPERADTLKAELKARLERPPDPQVAALISKTAKSMEVRQ